MPLHSLIKMLCLFLTTEVALANMDLAVVGIRLKELAIGINRAESVLKSESKRWRPMEEVQAIQLYFDDVKKLQRHVMHTLSVVAVRLVKSTNVKASKGNLLKFLAAYAAGMGPGDLKR